MNWINLKEKVPPYDKEVILYEKKGEDKHMVDVGYLNYIDKHGYHWNVISLRGKATFNPTHWCEIIEPKEE